MAPYKVIFFSLLNKDSFIKIIENLENNFWKSGIMCKSDIGSSAIGRRYARTDEIGIPFGVTIDF